MNLSASTSPVVLLVDHRRRDLDQAALIGCHLRDLDVECFLEPLEAYRAVIAAHRPGMIVFNHLNGSHLVEWSKRLADIGVLVAVLPNEGIAHDAETQRYLAGRYHNDAHIDLFFCWNESHRRALAAEGFDGRTQIDVVGVPRFDFYFEPWSRAVHRPQRTSSRPHILVCTNFGVARFKDLPREKADRFFAAWADRVPAYKNYWDAIESNWNSRRRFLDYLDVLIAADKFEVTLRPHPREDFNFYKAWVERLPQRRRTYLRLDGGGSVSGAILDCDLEISGESCTTAVEAWLLGKPTVELVFDRYPVFFKEERSRGNVHCEDPSELVAIVEHALGSPVDPALREARRQYLEKWCAKPDGRACRRIAEIAVAALRSRAEPDWSKLAINDYRRAAKLRATNSLDIAYHFDPLLPIKSLLNRGRYAIRRSAYEKAIKPSDVIAARKRLESASRQGAMSATADVRG